MLRAELRKVVSQRVPRLLLGVMLLGHLGPSLALTVYTPDTQAGYSTTWTHVFQILPSIVAIAFGGWVLGTEYRQDTLKRLLTNEPRRGRVLAAKAFVGASVLVTSIVFVALAGWLTARGVAAMHGYTVAWNGRELLSGGLFALGAATVAFALSAVTRNDAAAMVATLALVLILDPLLARLPLVGKFTFAGALETITARVGGNRGGMFDTTLLSNLQATLTLSVWLGGFLCAATLLFNIRDV